MSAVGWIVGSLQERDAALELLRGEGEAEPRDELGIGLLRDAIAEAFFPGVTTLQTRAKYFLLVPSMYQEIENTRSRVPAARRIRELEVELLERLRGTGERGIIGSQRWYQRSGRRDRRVPVGGVRADSRGPRARGVSRPQARRAARSRRREHHHHLERRRPDGL